MDKVTIRKNMKEIFNKLTNSDIVKYSKAITKTIKELDVFKDAENIFLFSSFGFEPETKDLIDYALSQGKKVYLPTIVFNEMYPVQIDKDTKYYLGKYNIKEPFGDIYFGEMDLAIIPMTAFDSSMTRLGKGGGYYDKYLSTFDTFKLAVGYSFMQVDEIEKEEHDVKMDAIVTEKGVIYANN